MEAMPMLNLTGFPAVMVRPLAHIHPSWTHSVSSVHDTPAIPAFITSHTHTILLTCAVLCFLSLVHRLSTRPALPTNHVRQPLPPPSLPQFDPVLGLSTILSSYYAVSQSKLLPLIASRFATTGNTYSARMINENMIATCEPANIKAILATQFQDFELGHRRKDAFSPLLGHSIFASDGPTWKAARSALRPSFARERVGSGTVGRHAEALVAAVKRAMLDSTDGSVDLQPLFFRLSLDIATDFFFGTSCSSLSPSSPASADAEAFAHAFTSCQETLVEDFVLGPVAKCIPHWSFRRERGVIHDFIQPFIDRAMAAAQAEAIEGLHAPGLLAELASHVSDPDELRDQALSLLVAGRDTTASLLSNLWHVISQRDDLWAQLQAEVATLGGRRPDMTELKELRLLQACLKESLRLHPPVPVNVRQSIVDTTLPSGGGPDGTSPIPVPAGTIVSYSVYAMHRRPDLWGPDADDFNPQRWEGRRPGWEFLPFNGGARICLGQQLALAEAGYTTVALLQEFANVENKTPGPWMEHLSLTCCVEGGVNLKLS